MYIVSSTLYNIYKKIYMDILIVWYKLYYLFYGLWLDTHMSCKVSFIAREKKHNTDLKENLCVCPIIRNYLYM
jgi:hypothetical protein